MAALQCEICGGKLIGKPGGVFECDSCGMEYSTEWAKAKVQEIKGTVKIEGPVEVTGTVKVEGGASVDSLLKQGWMTLEDSGTGLISERRKSLSKIMESSRRATELFRQVLTIDSQCAEAYLGLAMADWGLPTREHFTVAYISGRVDDANKNFKRAKQFAGNELKNWLEELERKKEEERQRKIPILAERRKKLTPAAGLIGAGVRHTVGLKADGTVVAVGSGQCNVGGWRDIVAVSVGSHHIVGLKADGTVVAAKDDSKDNEYGQCNVGGWRDIVAVSAGVSHTVGLKADGTVVAVGNNEDGQCNVSGWRDIVAVSADGICTVGLKADGTVVMAKRDNEYGQCKVDGWTDIVAVSGAVGLRADGTVVTRDNTHDVSGWRDIVAVSVRGGYTVGLNADGTVVEVGSNSYHQWDVFGWRDIVAVSAGFDHTVGLKADGTVVAVGRKEDGQCNVQNWKLFNSIDTLEQEREQIRDERQRQEAEAEAERQRQEAERQRQEAERQAKIAALEAEKQSVQAEIANCKGLFSGGKRRELGARLAKIEEELKALSVAAAAPAPAPASAAGETAVKSPIPGNIYKVECSVGQSVNAGDVLVVLEAMKMEIAVTAPVAGTVKAVTAVVGTTVNTDALLVILS